ALIGGSLALLVLTYAEATLASTFLVTAAAFAGLSLIGYVTKRNLSGLGAFLTVALLGLILASLVNAYFSSPPFDLALKVIGVLVFAGLIAVDTHRLRQIYAELDDPQALGAATSFGALTLYLNLVNLFQLLLPVG